MGFVITGLAAPVALACVALIGYVVGKRQRRGRTDGMLKLARKLDQTNHLIAQVESISEQLRRSMATHHCNVTQCREQIQVLSQRHNIDPKSPDTASRTHLLNVLAPTERLSDDIAHAYDELRQHSRALRRLRRR